MKKIINAIKSFLGSKEGKIVETVVEEVVKSKLPKA